MKRLFTLLVLLLALCVSSCSYDDSAIWGKITEMEKEQNEMQEQLDAQQTLLDALANNLTITAVTQTDNGYTITFSDGTSMTIKDGEKGDKGDKGEQGDSFIESIVVGEEYVTFTLADGTVIVIPLGSGGSSDGGEPSAENNKIYYTTTDGKKLFPQHNEPEYFGAIIVSNIYKDGIGVITFDDEVTLIGEEAFYVCRSLTSITIPDSVTEIGYEAFAGCSSLTSITIPDSVTTIGYEAFAGCISLTEFKGKFASEDGRCLIIDGTLNSFALAGVTEYTIPDSVTEIGEDAFYGCSSLTSVTIPDSVTTIRGSAFHACSSLTSVTIPDSVTAIGDFAFYDCSSLTSVTIPDSVTAIGEYAFDECSSLESVYCKPTTPPSIDYGVFDNNTSGRKIYVPAESVAAYQTASYWSNYASDIVGYEF